MSPSRGREFFKPRRRWKKRDNRRYYAAFDKQTRREEEEGEEEEKQVAFARTREGEGGTGRHSGVFVVLLSLLLLLCMPRCFGARSRTSIYEARGASTMMTAR